MVLIRKLYFEFHTLLINDPFNVCSNGKKKRYLILMMIGITYKNYDDRMQP